MANFNSIPVPVTTYMHNFLTYQDLCSAFVSKKLKSALDTEQVWREKCQLQFPHFQNTQPTWKEAFTKTFVNWEKGDCTQSVLMCTDHAIHIKNGAVEKALEEEKPDRVALCSSKSYQIWFDQEIQVATPNGNSIKTFPPPIDPTNNRVYLKSMIFDDKYLVWMFTNGIRGPHGAYIWNLENNERIRVEGLFSSCHKTEDGRLIFGGVSYAMVNPQTKKIKYLKNIGNHSLVTSDGNRVVALRYPTFWSADKRVIGRIWEGTTFRKIEMYNNRILDFDPRDIKLKSHILFINFHNWRHQNLNIIQALDLRTGKLLYEKYYNGPIRRIDIVGDQLVGDAGGKQIICLNFSTSPIFVPENVREERLQEIPIHNRPLPPPIIRIKRKIKNMIQQISAFVASLFKTLGKIFRSIIQLPSRT